MPSANTKVGGMLGVTAVAIYIFTMYHLKTQAPGNLDNMEPLAPSEKAYQSGGSGDSVEGTK